MLLQLLIGVALMILGYVLMPRKQTRQKPTEMDGPTATSREIGFLFGDKWINDPNYLGWWDKQYKQKEDTSGDKK